MGEDLRSRRAGRGTPERQNGGRSGAWLVDGAEEELRSSGAELGRGTEGLAEVCEGAAKGVWGWAKPGSRSCGGARRGCGGAERCRRKLGGGVGDERGRAGG